MVWAYAHSDGGIAPARRVPAIRQLVAARKVRYAKLVGRENVLAGTDYGLGPRIGHPSICWGKFEELVEGARRATKILGGRGTAAGTLCVLARVVMGLKRSHFSAEENRSMQKIAI